MRRKLKEKKFSQELIEALIIYLKKIGLIDDFEFARYWISSRIRRPLGMKRLFYELKVRGVSEDIFTEAAKEFKDFSEEQGIVKDLAQKRLRRINEKEKDKYKARSKVYAFLARRGFSSDSIRDALSEL